MPPAPAAPTSRPRGRPHARYKAELHQRIAALGPRSVLDVGCGRGDLLASPLLSGCPTRTGLEVATADVAALRAAGFDAWHGEAEALPFADGTFDVVVFDYVAHHLFDLPRALREAARVARRAVLILDPWYDTAVPSQQVAQAFDLWSKVIDRTEGMVHHPCLPAAALAAPFEALGGFSLDYRTRLILEPLPYEQLVEESRRHLARLADTAERQAALAPILRQAARHGVSEDGSILFVAERRP